MTNGLNLLIQKDKQKKIWRMQMSKFDGVWIFLLGIPIVLMAWDTMSNPYGYYMSVEANQHFPLGILIVASFGAMGLLLLVTGLVMIYMKRND
mgnify:FL=1